MSELLLVYFDGAITGFLFVSGIMLLTADGGPLGMSLYGRKRWLHVGWVLLGGGALNSARFLLTA